MSEIKKKYWLIPLIGGLFSLIGFLIPAWYSPPIWVEYIWIIGIIHHVTGGNVLARAPLEMFIPSIITTVLISICSFFIILNALFKSRNKSLLIKAKNSWIILAILEIISMIYYTIGIQFGFFQNTGLNFWDFYEIQFGLIIPFIGAGLTLIGAIIGFIVDFKSVARNIK
ncbi:MAG: hypothetical protein ACFFKA_18505 [Candidatus Thorarchaeota archaeon]